MIYTPEQKRSHIRELQGYLYLLSKQDKRIPQVIPDGIYGSETAMAVRAFQQAYGLPVTGEVDRATWEAIVAAFQKATEEPAPLEVFPTKNYVLRQGDTGDLGYIVQLMLNALSRQYDNINPVQINGNFDDSLADGVRNFQNIIGLPITGSVDLDTWNMLAVSAKL